MKRLLKFNGDGAFIEEEIVPYGTVAGPNQYLADIDAYISFERITLVDGELVEGLTPEELDELNKPVEQEPSPEERIAQLEQENKLLKAQNIALTERTDFHEEVLTEIILKITP